MSGRPARFRARDRLTRLMAKKPRVPAVDLDAVTVDEKTLQQVPEDIARKHDVFPVRRDGKTLTVAMANPGDVHAIDVLRFITGAQVEPVPSPRDAIARAIERHYGKREGASSGSDAAAEPTDEIHALPYDVAVETGAADPTPENEADLLISDDARDSAPVVKLVNGIIAAGVQKDATHIHIEPVEDGHRVRFRIDGQLRTALSVPKRFRGALTSRLKIISNLNIAEKRLPQEGSFTLKLGEDRLTLRVYSLPTRHGERFSLEIVDRRIGLREIDELGFLPRTADTLKGFLRPSARLILISGPRRSGKTTTLYSTLNHLKADHLSILTAEDPIEGVLAGVSQTQVAEASGLSYPRALEAMIQQDPDILMVPEIGDPELASTVIRIALDGFTLLSSLDTRDAPATLVKLLELGVDSTALGNAVSLILSQRLVRKVCKACRVEAAPSERESDAIAELVGSLGRTSQVLPTDPGFSVGEGCDECGGTGYRGRLPVCEILEVNPPIQEALGTGPSWKTLRTTAIAGGMETLAENALRRAAQGDTSLEECMSILQDSVGG